MESAFKWALRESNVDPQLNWEDVKPMLDFSVKELEAIPNEDDQMRVFKVRKNMYR